MKKIILLAAAVVPMLAAADVVNPTGSLYSTQDNKIILPPLCICHMEQLRSYRLENRNHTDWFTSVQDCNNQRITRHIYFGGWR